MGRIPLTLLAAPAGLMLLAGVVVSPEAGANSSMIEQGKAIAFDRKKGNCMSCHVMDGADQAGTIGPPLVAMQERFPDKSKLRAQIWDPTKKNPQSMMPPFGRHEILTDEEIDKVVEYILSL